jgi:hypothetical protein
MSARVRIFLRLGHEVSTVWTFVEETLTVDCVECEHGRRDWPLTASRLPVRTQISIFNHFNLALTQAYRCLYQGYGTPAEPRAKLGNWYKLCLGWLPSISPLFVSEVRNSS